MPNDPYLLAAAIFSVVCLLAVVVLAAKRTKPDTVSPALLQAVAELKGVLETQRTTSYEQMAALDERRARSEEQAIRAIGESATTTARAIGAIEQRLTTIDSAQDRIQALSHDIVGLRTILSNKQTRGAFGEMQMAEILANTLTVEGYSLQSTLSNGRRPDALVHSGMGAGPIAIDAKFPLESYEAYIGAETNDARTRALAAFKQAVQIHIKAIAEKYILDGETASIALMFLPSEAVYATLHDKLGDTVRDALAKRVCIVGPTTLMATLTTIRASVRDMAIQKEAGKIRKELALLGQDLERLGTRITSANKHFEAAQENLEGAQLSWEKAGKRAARLAALDFGSDEPAPTQPALPFAPSATALPETDTKSIG
jgi:DNA recombination protein RmuC